MNRSMKSRGRGAAWWQWPTVLSLDAPAVAMAWQALFAEVLGVSLRPTHYGLLGLVTWLVYAMDRWVEGWQIDPAIVCTDRHRFYQQFRWPVAVMILLVSVGAAVLALMGLTRTEWAFGLAFSVPVLLYLMAGSLMPRTLPRGVPKEVWIALLFAVGAGCFPMARAGAHAIALVPSLLWFALLCLINLALIASWESAVDQAHGQHSLALTYPGLHRWMRWVPGLFALSAALAAGTGIGGPFRVLFCVSASGILLAVLNVAQERIGRRCARALADAVLLTPLLLLFFSGG